MEGVIYRVSGTRANAEEVGNSSLRILEKEGRLSRMQTTLVGPLTDRERIVAGVATSLLELSSS